MEPTDVWYRKIAVSEYDCDDIEIDEDAEISRTDYGAWVQAWVYVANPNERDDDDATTAD